MPHEILIVLALIFGMCLLYMASRKLKLPYPMFLVLGGLAICFIPGTPTIRISPELIFLIFLPPILYEAAWLTSWNDFWRWRRAITSLAFPLVFITSLAVAFVSQAVIPGFTWALGFMLGGIVSPPDAVAANSVMREVTVPKRISTILEGESLLNDASSLIVFRFALAAVLTGQFALKTAIGEFLLVVIMGISIGVAIGFAIFLIHKLLPTTATIDVVISLISPYLMYLTAELFHFSGVLAVVSGGLFLSSVSHKFLNYETRIRAQSVWEALIFLLNGLIFILIGLQLPAIMEGMQENYSIAEAVSYALLITLTVVGVRILYVFPSTYIPRLFLQSARDIEETPPVAGVFLIGWAGMRGVVSLATALSIPLLLESGEKFPFRNLILFITFIVILITLLVQGLSLKWLIPAFKLRESGEAKPKEEQLAEIRVRMARVSLDHLNENYTEEVNDNPKLSRFYEQLEHAQRHEELLILDKEAAQHQKKNFEVFSRVFLELVRVRRYELLQIRKEKTYDDHVLREIEHTIDLEEARMRS